MKQRSSQSSSNTTCSEPGSCYDSLISRCVSCADRSKHSSSNLSVSARSKINNTTCHHLGLCYDRLIEQCVSCGQMQRGAAKEKTTILRAASTTAQLPAPLAVDQACSALTFGLYVFVGLVLAMAMLWLVTNLKRKRRKGMRNADEEDPNETEPCIVSVVNEAHKRHGCQPRNEHTEPVKCPHANDTSITAEGDVLKRNMDCIAMAGSDVTEAVSLSSCDKKNTIPVPATELGSTMLVTTKTTQENFISKESLQQLV